MADLADELRAMGFLDKAVALNLGTLAANEFRDELRRFDEVVSFAEPYSKSNALGPLWDSADWASPASMNWLYAERGLFALEQTFYGRHVCLSQQEALSLIAGAVYQAQTVLADCTPEFILDNSFLGLQRLALRSASGEHGVPLLTLRTARLSNRYRLSETGERALEARYASAVEAVRGNPEEATACVARLRKQLDEAGSINPGIKQASANKPRTSGRLVRSAANLNWARRSIERSDYLAYRASRRREAGNRVVRAVRNFRNRQILTGAPRSIDFRPKRLAFTWHFQPEQSTSQGSPYFVHQARFVENVSRAMPLGWELVVVPYWTRLSHMKVSDARTLRMLPNVTISRPEQRTGDVLAEADAVVALTGTSGFEGLVLGKPVFVFGDPDWRICKSATTVRTFDELTDLLRNVEEYVPETTDVAAFVEALHSVSVELEDGRTLTRRPEEARGSATYKADIKKVAALLVATLEENE